MLDRVLSYLRCPNCTTNPLQARGNWLACPQCSAIYPFRDGVLDMLGDTLPMVITPFQRIMQMPWVAAVYERRWRQLGYFLASSRSFQSEIQSVLGLFGGTDASPILDLACGPAVFTRPLAMRISGIVFGLDLSWPMLRQARRRLDACGIKNVFLIRGTVFHLPFLTGSLPRICCCGALHLFNQPDAALREIARVSSTYGRLCVQTTIRPVHSAGIAFFLERFIRFGFFCEQELREKLARNSFKILEQERHRISYTFLAEHISGARRAEG